VETRSTLIRGGRVIDPAGGVDQVCDVLIGDGKVRQVGRVTGRPDEVIDGRDLIVCPGLIDMHVHLREPGDESAETIASGSAAAVAGGFASIVCMPNTIPPLDNEAQVEFVYRQAARANLCNVYPVGAITKGRQGKDLAEMGSMLRAGAVGFSDDGCGVDNAGVMRRAFQYISMFDKPLIQHCEVSELSEEGVMHAGYMSVKLGLPGIPAAAEELMIQRDLKLLEGTGGRYHVSHISTAGAVDLVRQAKGNGLSVTCEVCPHHLLLTDEACAEYDTHYKMKPPLRTRADAEACIAGVADGTIDCLATDHAPHGLQAKELEFLYAPFGIIGMECALALFVKALVAPGHISWSKLIAMMAQRPAEVLGLSKGTLRQGADADVTLIDPEREWTIDTKEFRSKSRNCPFDGWKVKGKAVTTIVGGEVKYRDRAMATA